MGGGTSSELLKITFSEIDSTVSELMVCKSQKYCLHLCRMSPCSDKMLPLLSLQDVGRVKTECDGTSAETRFGLLAKQTSPFISAGVSVQLSTGFLGVRVGGERLYYL